MAESPITNQFDRCNISPYQAFDAATGINWYTGALGLDSAVASRLPGVIRGIYRFTTVSKGAASFGSGLAAALGGVLTGQAVAPLVLGVFGMGAKGAWYIMDKGNEVTVSGLLLAMGTGFAYGASAWVNPGVAAASFGVGVTEALITNQFVPCKTTAYDLVDAGTGINWYSGAIGLDSAVASRLPGVARGIYRFATSGKGAATVTAVGATYLVGSAGTAHRPMSPPCTAR